MKTDAQVTEQIVNLIAPPMGLGNRVKAQVIENGKVIRETGWTSNLILDRGMDLLATKKICQIFRYCAVGTGNTPTEDDSGAVTVTTSGTTATASGAFFSAGDVDKLLRCDDGKKAKITAFTDTTHVTLDATLAASTQLFTLYRITQTGLATEVKRSNTYVTGAGNCESTRTGGLFVNKMTFDFTAEVGSVNYAEVGFSDLVTVASNMNTRALFAGGAVTVTTGQQLRVIYEFRVTVSPISPRQKKFEITGWPALQNSCTADSTTDKITKTSHGLAADAEVVFGGSVPPGNITFGTSYYVLADTSSTFKVAASPGGAAIDISSNGTSVYYLTNTRGSEQLTKIGLSKIDSSNPGSDNGWDLDNGVSFNLANEPCEGEQIMITEGSTAHPTYPSLTNDSFTSPSGGQQNTTLGSYVAGSYTRLKSCTFSTSQGNSSLIRGLHISSGNGPRWGGIYFLFDYPQEKSSLNTLTVNFRCTWDRDFS